MVIEVSGVVKLGLKTYAWFQNWFQKYDFRPELQDTKFSCYFITAILAAIWFVTLNKIWNMFGCAV